MEEEKNKSYNNITKEQESILKQEIKFIHEEFKNKIEEHKRLKEELKNVKKSFHMGLNDYTIEKNLTIEKEQEIESLLSKISKMLKMMSLSINQTINKKFYTHLLEISNNRNKEKILLKFFNFVFNVYNYSKIYINNMNIGNADIKNDDYFIDINNFVDNTQSVHELLTIIRNENEIKNILVYSYDIFHNLLKENEEIYLIIKKSYFELFNEINNTERQYPLDFLFDFMKNNFNIIDLEKQVEELKNSLNKLIQEKNAKFVEVKNIESVIKTYNRNCKIISNYIKALKSFYYRIKEQNNPNNENAKNNDAIKELIEDINKFKKLRLDYDKINSNFDAMTSLSFGTNYTLSEKSSIKSSIIDSKNNNEENNSDNENININLNLNINENKDESHNDKNNNDNKENNEKNNQNKEKKIEPKTNKNKNALNKKDNINIDVKDINNNNENDNKLMNKMINKNLANKSINLNKNKNLNKNNNSYIGKRNTKTLDKKNISLSKQNMKIINMNNLTSTEYSTNVNNKSQIKKQLHTRSFATYKNQRPKKNSSFNKETKNKKLNTNDKKMFQSKIKAQKTLNNKQVNKKYKANNNSSHNYSNIIKNKNIIKITNDKIKKKDWDKQKEKNHNISINKKNSTQIMESKNTTTFDDLNKTKNMKDESNRTQNEKGDKNINPILSPISYTNTLKLYNPSDKNTEKEFDKPFLLNSNQKYNFNGNNRYNISKKIEQLKKKEPEDYIEIIMPNKENNVNDEYFNPNNMNDSICDEMISQNFGTANSLIRSTTNDYINRLGFKNNVLWSENLYRNKALKFKSNFKKLNIEKPIDTSSCCASCT
jgi:hypothetical protein